MPIGSQSQSDDGGTSGESYGAILLPEAAGGSVLDVLRAVRFTGWVAPPADGWIVVLGQPGDGVVASGSRGVIEVGAALAATADRVLVIRVRADRQLSIVAWRGGDEVGRYCSDPSLEPGFDDDVMSDPLGAEDAAEFAALCGSDEVVEKLGELLEEELDTESVFESERAIAVLRLLGLPTWIVAAGGLPRSIPTGPSVSALTRLRAGKGGTRGFLRNRVVKAVRRRRKAPPVIADPPRSNMSGYESWML